MSELQNPEFWRRIDERMSRAAELGRMAEELGKQNRAQIEQLKREIAERETPHSTGITWNAARFGLATTTAPARVADRPGTLARLFGARRRLLRP